MRNVDRVTFEHGRPWRDSERTRRFICLTALNKWSLHFFAILKVQVSCFALQWMSPGGHNRGHECKLTVITYMAIQKTRRLRYSESYKLRMNLYQVRCNSFRSFQLHVNPGCLENFKILASEWKKWNIFKFWKICSKYEIRACQYQSFKVFS